MTDKSDLCMWSCGVWFQTIIQFDLTVDRDMHEECNMIDTDPLKLIRRAGYGPRALCLTHCVIAGLQRYIIILNVF